VSTVDPPDAEPEHPPVDPEPAPPREPEGAVAPSEPDEDKPSTWQPMLYAKILLLLLVVAYVIAFVVQNTDQIKIDFVFASARVHLIWEMLLLLAAGLVGGVLLSQLHRHRRRAKLAKDSRKSRDS
jgi:uncharacterized integral membrane protein